MKVETKSYPKRLIEVDLPIRRISEHARREKSIRHGHISTLHIWWARRPLAACRAVICASLWPDPADPECPDEFVKVAKKEMLEWTDHKRLQLLSRESQERFNEARKKRTLLDNPLELRKALLDFIADFANWDNSANSDFISTSRALTQAAHESLGGEPGTRPLVIDPFAGGGSIPLEALRVGADAFASDLNPVPVLLNKVVLEYTPTYGQRLADEVRKWGAWIKQEAEKELAEFYPKDPEGAMPIAYLWARTIQCEGPGCGAKVPLIRNMQITRDAQQWHFNWELTKENSIGVQVARGQVSKSFPSVAAGSVTCPRKECGYTTPAKAVRLQLQRQNGGAKNSRLLAVCFQSAAGKIFRTPSKVDERGALHAEESAIALGLPEDEINSIRPYKNTRGLSAVTRIGITEFGHLYTNRQAITIRCFQDLLLKIPSTSCEPGLRTAMLSVLHCAVSRFIFQNCSLSRWHATRSTLEGAFGKQALQIVWDFAEANPIGDGPANWDGAIDWVTKVIEANKVLPHPATVCQARAQDQILPDDAASALITDPPYFAAIPYSDLSNFFFVWEREFFKAIHPGLYSEGLVKQEDEIIVTNANLAADGTQKSPDFYKAEMAKALVASRCAVAPYGIGVIVFADSSTESWEAILGAVIEAGWIVTGSWPIDTELQTRTQADASASLQSSVHIVCRPRENPDGSVRTDEIGDWRDVLHELPRRIHDWMPRLAEEGVVGADAIFACLGPALEIFSRYFRVEKASGEPVHLKEYLEHVWAAVSKEALSVIFEGASTEGFEPDARLTAMWLWTIAGSGTGEPKDSKDRDTEDGEAAPKKSKKPSGFSLEYDAARKIAQSLGAHLEDLRHLIALSGDTARLLPVSERTAHLFGKQQAEEPLKRRKPKKKDQQLDLFAELSDDAATEEVWAEKTVTKVGETTLDRVHQSMILFAANRGEALKRFLVEDGAGKDPKFWRLAQALSALYPSQTDEKRWVDGVLARKKGLGL
jgi:putative DNA methylase